MAVPSVAGVTYVIVVFVGSLVGTIVCLLPAAPLLWLAPALYVRWTDAIESLYFTFGAAMIRCLLGVKLVVHGDSRSRTLGVGNHIVISNHRYVSPVAYMVCDGGVHARCTGLTPSRVVGVTRH